MLGVFALVGVASVVPAMAQMVWGVTNDGLWWDTTDAKGGNMLGDNEAQEGSKLITTVKNFINWMLGILATIALAICIYAGFIMVTASGDDAKYKKGMTILKQAGIGLVIIGLAWLIVSVIFWVVWTMSA